MDEKQMKRRGMAYGVVYSVLIAFMLAIVMGLAAPTVGGHPITLEGFLWNLLQGTVLGALVGIVLPIPKIVGFYFDKVGADSKMAKTFVTCILLSTLFAVVMVFYFTAVNTGFGSFMTDAGPMSFMNRFMDGFNVIWAYIFVGAFVCDPLCNALASKLCGFNPEVAATAREKTLADRAA